MPDNHLRRTEDEGVLVLAFDRPEKLNAVSPDMLQALSAALADFDERDDLRVLLITGTGRYFTAGIDIGSMRSAAPRADGSPPGGRQFRAGYRRLHDLLDRLESCEKPVVLAAQGNCLGLGVEMSASCDYRLAAEGAVFGLPEIANLGMIPGSGGISRLARLIGPHWTAWMAIAGEQVDAAHALHIGLVHTVYPAAEFPQKALAFAHRLAALPGEALCAAKVALRAATSSDRSTARDVDRLVNTLLAATPEHGRRVEAFRQRRTQRP